MKILDEVDVVFDRNIDRDVVFSCRKCEHQLYVSIISKNKLEELMDLECPICGEEGYGNWVLLRTGNYDVEHGE